eukprot:jgi/Orpsp1_1/1182843/evm.model.c7180000082866.1
MKFVPWQAKQCCETDQNDYTRNTTPIPKDYRDFFLNIPFHHAMGVVSGLTYSVINGCSLVYHTQQLYDIGFIPEMVLDDMAETNATYCLQFPFHYAEYKKLFESNHPRAPIWRKYLKDNTVPKKFNSGGAPLNPNVKKYFQDNFDITIVTGLGSSEGGYVLYDDLAKPNIPGEEGYFSRVPWVEFYLKPLNEDEPNICELFTRSHVVINGYFGRAKPGEFYDSPVPGMRCDIGSEDLFITVNGVKYYKTNDVVKRSPVTGRYKFVSRIDSIITFATGLKMNPLPFENTINYECSDITRCCLILDTTQTEVVCFVEPNWSEIVIDGKKFDTSVDPSTLDRDTIKTMSKIAQQQTWNSIYKVLMDDSKSLTSWTKQLTINNLFIIEYGKKFPSTDKGSLSRRVARLQYANVLKYISKLISGELSEIPEEGTEVQEENENEEKEKTNENIQASFNSKDVDKILNMEGEEGKSKETTETEETTVDEEKSKEIEEKEGEEQVKSKEEINEEIQETIKLVYQSIKEIIPSTPDFESFNPESPFTVYGIDSLSTIKLTNVLSRKLNKRYSPAILFNYGNTVALAKFLSGNVDKKVNLKETIPSSLNEKNVGTKIAIIGMALRLPGAINSAKSLWMTLAKGKDCVLPPVKTRDLHRNYVNKPSELLVPPEHNVPRLGLYDTRSNVAKPSQFDAEFFNFLPEEALALDPRHRWILETSWEALENAGIPPDSLEDTATGVFVGINDDHEYADLMDECNVTAPISAHGTSPSDIAGRLSYFYRLYGPSFTMDTACSTGASALHTACRSLQFGDCDLSIVSGVKFMYSSKDFYKTCSARMTSPHGRCATFDKDADGFVAGEGCVTYILKRLDDAVRDNDHILSVIIGTSSGQSGLRQSISAPSSEGQALNIRKAMRFAGIKPEDVSYVEAHGTGTPLGDAIEVHALNEVYAGSHSEEHPLIVGSIKTNIGHTCETAGLAGVAKVIVSMQHKHIPKNLHFNQLNPEIDVDSIPMKIPTKTIPWTSAEPNKPLIAQVSSYGLQGSAINIFLEEYIPEKKEEEKETTTEKRQNNAKSNSALIELANDYLSILEKMEDENEDIRDLCYTSNIGRQHFDKFRLSVYGKNATELYDNLELKLEEYKDELEKEPQEINKKANNSMIIIAEDKTKTINDTLNKLMLELFVSRSEFREAIEACDTIISEITNKTYSLIECIINKENNNAFQEINTLSFYYALSKVIEKELDIQHTIYASYGIGEIISILINDGISLKKAIQFLKLVSEKSGNSQEAFNAWYEEKDDERIKLTKNIYCASQQKELKAGEVISKEYYYSLYQKLTEKQTNETKKSKTLKNMCNYMINEYGKKCRNISLFSQNISMITSLREMLESKITENGCFQITNNSIISFFDDSCTEECEKKILLKFISNHYMVGNNVQWKEFHESINHKNDKNYSCHKIELPNYPFQRLTFWPKKQNVSN